MIRSATSPEWVRVATSDIDRVLVDHAHCEKKAAASALSLVSGYPDLDELVRRLSSLAIEELGHFRAVHECLVVRGLKLGRDGGDPYAQQLISLVRANDGRLTDRLLVFGLIEARSHERLDLLGSHLPDTDLRNFYKNLARAEARHAELFLELARLYDDGARVSIRLEELARAESEIVARLPIEARIH